MTKYTSVNELNTFSFHDAEFRNIELHDLRLVWELVKVNVTTKNPQNHMGVDMEAGLLLLTFSDCRIIRIEYGGCKTYDKEGNLIIEEPSRIALEEDYSVIFQTLVDNMGFITRLLYEEGNSHFCSFEITIPGDGIIIDLEFSEVKAEWDHYDSIAWYVKRRNNNPSP